MSLYRHLSADERIVIEKLRFGSHCSLQQIAVAIGRSKSTVSRELKRNRWFASNENESYRPYRPSDLKTGIYTAQPFYSALTAQRKAALRNRKPRKTRRLDHGRLLSYVLDALRKGWSPELIAGRLRHEYPADPLMRVSYECIYQWIYRKPERSRDLRAYLARNHQRRRKRGGRKGKDTRIAMRVPIGERPALVDSRRQFGHYESDTVIGAVASKRCMNTQVERKTRRLFARLIDDKSAASTIKAEYEIYRTIPPKARRSRTWDNGTESALHQAVDEALGMLTYYADPYSSYQRGSNENRNGMIRRYLPKKTSFENLTQEELDMIVHEINNRPMKCLDYRTPNEAWNEEIHKLEIQSTINNHTPHRCT